MSHKLRTLLNRGRRLVKQLEWKRGVIGEESGRDMSGAGAFFCLSGTRASFLLHEWPARGQMPIFEASGVSTSVLTI